MQRVSEQECLTLSLHWKRRFAHYVGLASEKSRWWAFAHAFGTSAQKWILDLKSGNHQFGPLKQITFGSESVRIWSYLDRLMVHLLHQTIKPTFKHIISDRCTHLKGPSVIKGITQELTDACRSGEYHYFCRMDIKSYYASIDHKILLAQIKDNYDDPIVLKYLEDIITTGIDVNGNVILPQKGIPLRSSLSPFFGALYLDKLDRAFEKNNSMFYYRYMDDIIVLAKTERAYRKARKKVFRTLKDLKFRLSDRKTSMGSLVNKKGFHYLGVDYTFTRRRWNPLAALWGRFKNQVLVGVHPRTCRRAAGKVKTLRKHAVNPATIQRYLGRWAAWWYFSDDMSVKNNLTAWVHLAEHDDPPNRWLGSGLIAFGQAKRLSLKAIARAQFAKALGPIVYFWRSRLS